MVQRLGLSEDSCFLPEALEHRCTIMDKNKNTEDLIKEKKQSLSNNRKSHQNVLCVLWGGGWHLS